MRDVRCDLSDLDAIGAALDGLLGNAERLELVILNAGILDEIKRVMDVNVWSNKAIMDWLHGWGRLIEQVVMISSGASVLGNKGWGAYALSKAALTMLARFYAHEFPDTHIAAVAPCLLHSGQGNRAVPRPAGFDQGQIHPMALSLGSIGRHAAARPRRAGLGFRPVSDQGPNHARVGRGTDPPGGD